MEKIMIAIFNMSFTASCTALIVMLLCAALNRFRLPKKYSYWLWLAVLFRFLCPLVLTAPISLLPVNPRPIQQGTVYERRPEILTGLSWLDDMVNESVIHSLPPVNPAQSVNPVQNFLGIAFILWILGAAFICLYRLIQFLALKRTLSTSVYAGRLSQKTHTVPIRVSHRIDGAFTLGIFHPVIYLPANLEENAADLILCHEWIHIKRKDGLIKLLWAIAVAVHWFQPVSWIAFNKMCAHMEMSCDEEVLWERGAKEKARYSNLLLNEAEKQSRLILPLAFGKSPVSRRIQNILSYKKPGKAIFILGGIITAAALAGLFVSPKPAVPQNKISFPAKQYEGEDEMAEMNDTLSSTVIIGGADGPTSIFIAGKLTGNESHTDNEKPMEQAPEELLNSVRLVPNWPVWADFEDTQQVFLDIASENVVIFHGTFGIFAFSKNDEGIWHQDLFIPETKNSETVLDALQKSLPNDISMSRDSIHPDDRLTAAGDNPANQGPELAAAKMENGKIAVLGGHMDEDGTCRLKNLWYGYYDPKEQILHQVFLFAEDTRELENPKGQIP